ncbi:MULTISPECIES: DUF6328 family protein [unclassified Rhodococcus (in: high G+C Gram-positive bacteria)]|uniref:DUF6328 family protein n=1 Tax=unclassified Rhodococcus (in: high G+C Gram-positive bacteria) TaxID=192944 RepID=UPI00163B5A55|nr:MULTISPECIES: DUF6328 family protein [unclassified Rhodococcus (in: high G+C Gram-positive bacteria)]MBC2640814.1 sodium:proton antiporter [Rhodococcus sp. 3A]MBC2894441.1 sodium:proton antiporter [Rhodococcus sp. 4CII]
MDSDDDFDDAEWNRRVRDETETERLDRNWSNLLQELRVVQTGVQLLTGFLLTLPFQQRFEELSDTQEVIYLVTVALSVTATIMLIAPVGLHRLLFRQHALPTLVAIGQRLAIAGIAALGCALVGVVLLIFGVVVNMPTGVIAAAIALLMFFGFWILPAQRYGRPGDDQTR